MRDLPTLELECGLLLRGHRLIAGADEVGRGSWAGPLVAAAVILPCYGDGLLGRLHGVADSKQLTPEVREALLPAIIEAALAIGIGWVSHHVIDREGLGVANRRALLRAISNLSPAPEVVMFDHFAVPECPLPQLCVSKGDRTSLSIAAASIVAKVVRDRWMQRCEYRYPGYDFAAHKGYGTADHRHALERLGPSALHRRSFRLMRFCE